MASSAAVLPPLPWHGLKHVLQLTRGVVVAARVLSHGVHVFHARQAGGAWLAPQLTDRG
jgi:hypothetical protein